MSFLSNLFTGFGATSAFMQAYGEDQAKYQNELNKVNYKWTRKARQTEWQDTKDSMKNAGINPALAYSSGPVASDMTPTQATAENPIMQMLNIGMQAGAIGKQRAEVKEINERAELERQQQESETTKRDLMSAQKGLFESEKVINDKNAHWIDKRMAYEFQEIYSRTALNLANVQKAKSEITLNHTLQDLRKAETKYTNEKSRGHNLLNADTYSKGITGFINKIGQKYGRDFSYMDIFRND